MSTVIENALQRSESRRQFSGRLLKGTVLLAAGGFAIQSDGPRSPVVPVTDTRVDPVVTPPIEYSPPVESGQVFKISDLRWVSPHVDLQQDHVAALSIIDTPSFFNNEHRIGLNGTHKLSQYREGDDSYYVKWGRPDIYEHHVIIPDKEIQLKEDAGGDGYLFTPGTWMPRYWEVGRSIQVPNRIKRYKDTCFPEKKEEPFPYVMRLKGNFLLDVGKDLGVQNVIQVVYDYGRDDLPKTDYEVYYYAKDPEDGKGWGWIGWQFFSRENTTKFKAQSWFNKYGGQPVIPDLDESCGPVYRRRQHQLENLH